MVNHWYSWSTAKTACGQYSGPLADSISVAPWGLVSCPGCLEADYPDVSAGDIELRDFQLAPTECKPTEHRWCDIPDPGGYVGEECSRCGQNKANVVDPVSKPSHYNWHPSGVECKDIAEAFGYYLGNAIKYIWRADYKGKPIEDLQKARNCIDLELQRRAKQ